jgi:predicted  nucleic acid-binding Zn-ribbon protein
MSESGPSGSGNVLLDEAKRDQIERKQAAMQKELDRVAEDVNKAKLEMEDLEKSMSKVGNAVAETKAHLDQLAGRKKHIIQDLELMPLRIEADKLKAEGFDLLNSAHAKAMDALKKRKEELDFRAALVSAEIQKLLDHEDVGQSDAKRGKSDSQAKMLELRRNLQKAEDRSSLANEKAMEGMKAASVKFQQADAAAAKAEKKQAEIGLENSSSLQSSNGPLKLKAKNTQ